jgi:hypothetical protein
MVRQHQTRNEWVLNTVCPKFPDDFAAKSAENVAIVSVSGGVPANTTREDPS